MATGNPRGGQALADDKEHLSRAYNLAPEDIALQGLIFKPMSDETLNAVRTGVRTAAAMESTGRNGGEYAANATLVLLNPVTTAEMLERAQETLSPALAVAWAEGAKPGTMPEPIKGGA